MRGVMILALLVLGAAAGSAHARPFAAEDVVKEIWVASPDIAPAGDAVVYSVEADDLARDESVSQIWLAPWEGGEPRQLTWRGGSGAHTPKFGPDGAQVAFIAARDGKDGEDALWLLPLAGGEARLLPGIEGSVEDFAWSPDGRYLALILGDPEPELAKDADGEDIPLPVVIDRYRFKTDGVGYLGKERERLWLYELASGTAVRLTRGDYDEYAPAWSPDSSRIVFASRRAEDQDRTADSNLYIARVDRPESEPVQLTSFAWADNPLDSGSYPAWSPDGTRIAYIRGGDPALIWYAATELAVIPAEGGEPVVLTAGLDRNIVDPFWMADGASIGFILEDDGERQLASVPAGGGQVTVLLGGERALSSPSVSNNGHLALLSTTPTMPNEIHALDSGELRRLTRHNDDWLADIDLATLSATSFTSKDGTRVHGFVMLPAGAKPGEKLPTMLHPHGGPASQYDYTFDSWQQAFAGAGYAVLTPNPRGSTGRGTEYSNAIHSAWGSVDVEDVLAAVDDAVARGIADPERLVIGGWSYGGMLTNYTIATDQRFKAAMSGAGIANVFAGYGTDQYILEYELEVGTPWDNFEDWMRISFPFFENERIVTPTLFIVGDEDVNVPTLASEQMYQALKSRRIDTELVIYPGEDHSFVRPSFRIDRMKRWLAWYEAHLK